MKNINDDYRITAYALGELPEQEKADFEKELKANAELRAEVEKTKSFAGKVTDHFANEPLPPKEAKGTADITPRSAIASHEKDAAGRYVWGSLVALSLLVVVGTVVAMQSNLLAPSSDEVAKTTTPDENLKFTQDDFYAESTGVSKVKDERNEEVFTDPAPPSIEPEADDLAVPAAPPALELGTAPAVDLMPGKVPPVAGDWSFKTGNFREKKAESASKKKDAGRKLDNRVLAEPDSVPPPAGEVAPMAPTPPAAPAATPKAAPVRPVQPPAYVQPSRVVTTPRVVHHRDVVVHDRDVVVHHNRGGHGHSSHAGCTGPGCQVCAAAAAGAKSSGCGRATCIGPGGCPECRALGVTVLPAPGPAPAPGPGPSARPMTKEEEKATTDTKHRRNDGRGSGGDGGEGGGGGGGGGDPFGTAPVGTPAPVPAADPFAAPGAAAPAPSLPPGLPPVGAPAPAPEKELKDKGKSGKKPQREVHRIPPPSVMPALPAEPVVHTAPPVETAKVYENPFELTVKDAISTFSLDVDTASYSMIRAQLQGGNLPAPGTVRLEELVNYFDYGYEAPTAKKKGERAEKPFIAHIDTADCPWNPDHKLMKIGIKGEVVAKHLRPQTNIVFLIDVSGSMSSANRLPLVKFALMNLVDKLDERDKVTVVTYSNSPTALIDATACTDDNKKMIVDKINALSAGGSTGGEAGLRLAYKLANENKIKKGINRVLICSDGDFNVGQTGNSQLVNMVKQSAKDNIFFSALGFGMNHNYKDERLERLADECNGQYAFIDNRDEAEKVLTDNLMGALMVIAKDAKVLVNFNPNTVRAYRQLGYENRQITTAQFFNHKTDAAEIGAGQTVTVLYEVVMVDAPPTPSEEVVSEMNRYADKKEKDAEKAKEIPLNEELCNIRIRYKKSDQTVDDKSTEIEFPVKYKKDLFKKFGQADADFKQAACAAGLGMLLRKSAYGCDLDYAMIEDWSSAAAAGAAEGKEKERRTEFLELIRKARQLSGQ